MDGTATAVTRAIPVVLMTPEISAVAIHALALAQDNHPAAVGTNSAVRCNVGSYDRLLTVRYPGDFHLGCYPLELPILPLFTAVCHCFFMD